MAEILIRIVDINKNNGTLVVQPVGCPKEDSSEIKKDESGIYCIYNEYICPYLTQVSYNMKETQKTLLCSGA